MALRLRWTDDEENEKKAELVEHLAELRTRIIRSCLYVGVGMIVAWIFYIPIHDFLAAPIDNVFKHARAGHLPGGFPTPFVYTHFSDAFFMFLQIVMIGGVIIALPFVLYEAWAFIRPGLTVPERKAASFVFPLAIVLFAMGLACAYLILPMAITWFLSYIPSDTILLQNPLTYIVFVVKLMLIFGLLFQLPVVLMFLGKIGVINSGMMKKYWRQIAVGLFTVAMIAAPSNDPGTMLALAVPLTILFFGSIWLVQLVEPKDNDKDGK
jgi:sec-independent protein translocase protein TatC